MPARHSAKLCANGNRKTVLKTFGKTSPKTIRCPDDEVGYPAGFVGADPAKRDYIRYLTQRYNRYKQLEASSGLRKTRISYAFIFESIRSRFNAPTYFVAVERFRELADFIQAKIDRTPLGRRKRERCRSNYLTFDEHQSAQQRAAIGEPEVFDPAFI